jgi:hypothetical protein
MRLRATDARRRSACIGAFVLTFVSACGSRSSLDERRRHRTIDADAAFFDATADADLEGDTSSVPDAPLDASLDSSDASDAADAPIASDRSSLATLPPDFA